jgi:hypothetical protein
MSQSIRRAWKAAIGVALLALVTSVAYTQSRPIKIALTSASTVPSADIVKDMADQCPNVSVTLDAGKADFTIEASKMRRRFKFTLFDRGGTAVFSTSTRLVANAVKDVCDNIKKRS